MPVSVVEGVNLQHIPCINVEALMTVYISNYVIKVGGVTEALTFAVSFYGVKANRELSSKQAESPEHFSAMKTHSSVVASRCDSLHRPPPSTRHPPQLHSTLLPSFRLCFLHYLLSPASCLYFFIFRAALLSHCPSLTPT